MHPTFHLFGYYISAYWLMALLGATMAGGYVWLSAKQGPSPGLARLDVLIIACLGLLGAYFGGRLLYAATVLPDAIRAWQYYQYNTSDWLYHLFDGFVFYGGLLLALLLAYLYCCIYRVPKGQAAALFVPAIPLFHAFGRVGCLLAGCCWGVPTRWGVVFPQNSIAPAGTPLFPTQAVGAVLNLGLWLLLAVLARKLPQNRRWWVLPIYLTAYATGRFVLEFFRGDAERGVWVLSVSQWISLCILLAVGGFWFKRHRRRGHRRTPAIVTPRRSRGFFICAQSAMILAEP